MKDEGSVCFLLVYTKNERRTLNLKDIRIKEAGRVDA